VWDYHARAILKPILRGLHLETSSGTSTPSFGRKLVGWTKKIFLFLLGLAVVVAICGAIYELLGERRDAKRFPQRGKTFQAGNVALNIDCSGTGGPTVILDSGLGVPAAGWILVQPEVAKFTRVCSYDRAGYGWSGASPDPRTSEQIAKELKELLTAAGEKGPYIIVGHSFGGYNIRVFTEHYPADVAGMVLVDASHEDQEKRMTPAFQEFSKKQMASLKAQKILAPIMIHLGISRFLSKNEDGGKLSPESVSEITYLQRQAKYVSAITDEMLSFSQSASEVRATHGLGNRPLIVLTAGKSPELGALPPGLTKKDFDEFHEIWVNDLQVQESQLSTRGKRIMVPDSSHMIPMERPDAIVSAIHEVWTDVTAPH